MRRASRLLHAAMAMLAAGLLHAAPASVTVPPFERTELDNGFTLVTLPKRDVPLVAFTALVRGGSSIEAADRAGTASLTASLLDRGAGGRDAFEFADTVEGAGGSFGASAGAEAIVVSGQFLAKDQSLMVELIADVLRRPRFAPDEFARVRDRQVELLRAAKDGNAAELIDLYGRAFLFGAHPYATPRTGSEVTLAALDRVDVTSFHARAFSPDRITLIVTGDFDAEALRREAQRAFGDWPRAVQSFARLPAPNVVRGRRVLLVDQPESAQTYFWLANVGVSRADPRRAALDVLNTVYGGRFTSILNTELRVRTGLTYGASSSFVRGTVPGEFAISSFTQTETTAEALDLALATLANLKRDGLAPELIESGKSYLLGQYPLRLETASQWAAAMAELELYDLDRRYIEAYGAGIAAVDEAAVDVVVATAVPAVDDLVIVLIGDAARIREVAGRYGPVTELPISAGRFTPAPGD